jgi:hypothetical protein
MKKINLLFLIIPVFGFSQKPIPKKINTTNLDSIVYEISSKTTPPANIRLPFNAIDIIDARFDTSKLGFEIHQQYDNISYKDFKRIKLKRQINEGIQDFYNSYYRNSLAPAANKLLIVIKTLWIDNLPSSDFKEKRKYDLVQGAYQNIYIKFEYYLEKENLYYPLKRIDTVCQFTEKHLQLSEEKLKKNDLSFLTYTLKGLIENYDFDELISRVDESRKLTLNSIDSFNKKRFLIPILRASNINKGVYLNAKEFINNSPSIKAYTIKKIKGEEFLLINSDSVNLRNYWAIADSFGLHINFSGKNAHIKVGNTFEFFVADDVYLPKTFGGNLLSVIPQNIGNNRPVYGENKVNSGNGVRLQYVFVPRQINMENGEIY